MPKVTFAESGVTAEWTGEHESILELAEEHGLALDFMCRMGSCTTCQQPLVSGEVEYVQEKSADPDDGHELICSCIPKTDVVIRA